LVFSLLCLGVFSGCDHAVRTGRQIQHGADGSISETIHWKDPTTNTDISRTESYESPGDLRVAETVRWIVGLVKRMAPGPSN
jgi:hypothetical protein